MRPAVTLLDRDRELAEVGTLIERARLGEGGVLIVEGPLGIGKTAILDAAVELASGTRVLRGRGGLVERDLGFGLVRELFEPVLRAAEPEARQRWFAGAAAAAASVLGDAAGEAADPAAVAYGLFWLLASIADERPVVLVVDDLHECDPPSLRWLAYLARRVDGLAVAIVGATRPVEASALAAIETVRVLRPDPLGVAAMRELIVSRTGSVPELEFIKDCQAATGGNPLLLGEMLAPGGAVLARIGRLDPDAAALARAVSVLGDGCELGHASELAGLDRMGAASAVRSLIASGVLADEQPLAFAHSLVRDAVYGELPRPVRAAEHRHAAELLSAANAPPDRVSHHLLLSEPAGEAWALRALRDAADTAIGRGAPESAITYLRRALEERPDSAVRAELLRTLGNALVRLGDPAGVEALEAALELTASPAERAEIVDASIDPLLSRGGIADARRLIARALAARDSLDSELTLRLLARLAAVRAWDDEADDFALDELRALASTLDSSTPGSRYAAAALALLHALREGTAESAARLARVALGNDMTRRIDADAGRPLHIARVALALAGEPDEALDGLDSALAASRARGSLMGRGLGLGWSALIHSIEGDVDATENDGRASVALLAETGLTRASLGALVAVGWALIERGELDEAEDLLAGAAAPYGWGANALACVRAQLLIARHRYADAVVEIAPVEQLAGGARIPGPRSWRSLAAVAWLGTGDRDGARQLAEDDLAEARRFGSERQIGSALRVLGLVEGGQTGIETQHLAIERLRAAGARLELAHTLVELGAALRRGGERVASRAPLLEGLELAAACGATALVETARTELRAAGARPRSVVRSGIDALTPRERRVSALAADGLANAEIAQVLFVTVRTVEMHLSAAYRKLEISSRAALPQTLRSSTVAKREARPHPGGMTTTEEGTAMPFDTDLRAGASRMRWAGLSGRARGTADSGRTPLVFLHGLTFDRRMWDPILDALPDDQQAIAFDLPGHGSSPALDRHDLERVVEAVHDAVLAAGLDRPVLVGHSISAPIAAIYAARHPASGVVNVDGGVRAEPHVRFVQSIEPQLREQFDTVWSTIFRPSMHIELVPDEQRGLLRAGYDVDQEIVLGYWADLLTHAPDELAARVDTMMRQLGTAGTPYLSISREPLSPEDEAWLLERVPGAELEVWPVGHHFPQLEKPEGFAALVVAFAEGARV